MTTGMATITTSTATLGISPFSVGTATPGMTTGSKVQQRSRVLTLLLVLKAVSQDRVQQNLVELSVVMVLKSLVSGPGSTAIRGAQSGVGPQSPVRVQQRCVVHIMPVLKVSLGTGFTRLRVGGRGGRSGGE